MRAAAGVKRVVGVRAASLLLAAGVLEGNFDPDAVDRLVQVDGGVQHFVVAVQVGDELGDAAFVVERLLLAGPLVLQDDGQPLVQER